MNVRGIPVRALRSEQGKRRLGWVIILLLALSLMLSTAVGQACSVFLIAVWLVTSAADRFRGFGTGTLIDLAIPLLVLARLMSVIYSVDLESSLLTIRTEIPFYLLLYSFVWLFRRSSTELRVLLVQTLVAGALIASCIGIITYIGGYYHRAVSSTSGYYTLGMFLTAILSLVAGIGNRKEYFFHRLVWYAVLTVLLVGILMTFNRVHWFIAAAILVGTLAFRERRLLVVLGVLMGGMVLFYTPLRERLLEIFAGGGGLSDRDVLWREGMKLAGDRPLLGFGTRTFAKIFPAVPEQIDPGVASWHNDMLQIYLESGLVALVGYITLFGTPLFLVGKRIWAKRGETDPGLIGFGMMALSIVLGGLTGIFFTDPVILPLSYMSIALIIVIHEEGKPKTVDST